MKANTKTTEAVPVQVGSHTPGTWKVFETFGNVVVQAHDGNQTDLVAKVFGMFDDQQAANARLIAAAPALLAALQAIHQTCKEGVIHRHETGKPQWSAFDHMAGISQAAIAQAEAQPSANGHDLDRWEALQNELKHTKAALHEALQWHKDLCAALKALHLCKQAVENRSIPPSAREELVRDYSTPILQAYARR